MRGIASAVEGQTGGVGVGVEVRGGMILGGGMEGLERPRFDDEDGADGVRVIVRGTAGGFDFGAEALLFGGSTILTTAY